ncbi:MAG: hypothetical protein ABI743_06770, partial [bacterium]
MFGPCAVSVRIAVTLGLVTALGAGILGCHSGTPTDPAPAERHDQGPAFDPASTPVLVTSMTPDGTALAASGAIGAFNIHLDPTTMEASLTPLRNAQVGDSTKFDAQGDSLIVDATDFFTKAPCTDCLRLDGVGINGSGEVLLTMAVKHPFKAPTILTPDENIRWDLHVFDLEGVLLAAGDTQVVPGFSTAAKLLRNADGYTSQVNGIALQYFPALQAEAHPYKILAESNEAGNYAPTEATGWIRLDEPRGHNVLAIGGDYQRTIYRLKLASNNTAIDFGYLLTVSYGFSGKGRGKVLGQRGNPRYFLPEFNRKEAWRVGAEVRNNILVQNVPTSSAEVKVSVLDWQHSATTMADPFDALTSPLDQVTRSSKIASIELQIPDLMNTIPTKTSTDFTGSGLYDDPVTTTFLVLNANQAGLGQHWGLVTVIDELDASTDEPQWLLKRPTDTNPFPNFGAEAPIYRTYYPFQIPVTNGNHPPVAVISTPTFTQVEEQSKLIAGCSSTDPDTGLGVIGDIVQWQWDFGWDGDPANFSVDQVTTSCSVTHAFPDAVPSSPPTYIGLRVVDGGTPSLESSNIAQLPYTITASAPPVPTITSPALGSNAPAGTILDFTATAVDPDAGNGPAGNLTTTDWDFDWDGIPANFDVDASVPYGVGITHFYTTAGPVRPGVRIHDAALPSQVGYAQWSINVTAAPTPPATPVGNIILTLARSGSNGVNPGSYRPQSITLTWADVAGEAEYAIYWDRTPYGTGELLDDLQLLQTAPANAVSSVVTLPSNLQLGAAFVVRARSVINNALSETANSQPAFIELEGFEPPSFGDWNVGNEDPSASFAGNTLEPGKNNSGAGALVTSFPLTGFLQDFGTTSETRWTSAVSPQLPDFPSIATQVQTVKIEGVHRGTGWPCA